jgi:hypothetical protein
MSNRKSVVGIYKSHIEAEAAVRELQKSGFDTKKLSVVGKDYHTDEHVVGYYNVGDRMKAWGKTGAFWGGLWGLLFGSAFKAPVSFDALRRKSQTLPQTPPLAFLQNYGTWTGRANPLLPRYAVSQSRFYKQISSIIR